MVELEEVSIVYSTPRGPVPAVVGINVSFGRGEIHAVIGPSGSGKTSLVQAMAGLIRPDAGSIRIESRPLSGVRPRTAVIFQDYGLLPWKTVLANAELPLLIRGMRRRERRERVLPILEELGLQDFLDLHPVRLSGGMQQRLAVARALATEPDLLLMDEPFSSLDALTRESLQETLLEVHARHGATIILVTHSIEEAALLSDTVTVMTGRNPGRISARIDMAKSGATNSISATNAISTTGTTGATGTTARARAFRSSPDFLARTSSIRKALESAGNPETRP